MSKGKDQKRVAIHNFSGRPSAGGTITWNELVLQFHRNAENVVVVIVVRCIGKIELVIVGQESFHAECN